MPQGEGGQGSLCGEGAVPTPSDELAPASQLKTGQLALPAGVANGSVNQLKALNKTVALTKYEMTKSK